MEAAKVTMRTLASATWDPGTASSLLGVYPLPQTPLPSCLGGSPLFALNPGSPQDPPSAAALLLACLWPDAPALNSICPNQALSASSLSLWVPGLGHPSPGCFKPHILGTAKVFFKNSQRGQAQRGRSPVQGCTQLAGGSNPRCLTKTHPITPAPCPP